MAKLNIYKLKIDRKTFLKSPHSERVFYVRAMNFLTDVGILQKGLLFSINPKTKKRNQIILSAEHIQVVFFLRNLAGLLYEGWRLIQSGYYQKQLGENYHINELESIKKYFSNSDNIIQAIRKKFAYHLDVAAVENELRDLDGYKEFDIYLTEEQGNCFYMAGDHVLLLTIMKLTGSKDLSESFDRIFNEISSMAKSMQRFFGKYTALFHRKHLGIANMSDLEVYHLRVPRRTRVKTPYFIVNA